MRVAAVIPVKALTGAKSRLASVLSAAERAELALWMLERVVCAVAASDVVDHAFVVSPDRRVLEWVGHVPSAEWGARWIGPAAAEPSPRDGSAVGSRGRRFTIVPVEQQSGDLNAALDLGRREASAHDASGLIVFPGDLPALYPAEVREMVHTGHREGGRLTGAARQGEARRSGVVVLAPDRLGTGTNALFIAPPTAMPFAFGPRSCERHEAFARERGLRVAVYRSPGVAFDVDSPADLDRLADWGLPWSRQHDPLSSAGGRSDERTAG